MIRCLVLSAALLLTLTACKNSEECDRDRLQLSKTWGNVRESAAKRKLAGVAAEGWAVVENRAELLESSFMTSQVTWPSADKARSQLSSKLAELDTDPPAMLKAFKDAVEAAGKQQDAFAQKCR